MSLATLSSSEGKIELVIVQYSYALESQIESTQLQHGVVFYPIKVLQSDFVFTAQFNSIKKCTEMQDFVMAADKKILSKTFLGDESIKGALRFFWPEMDIDYQGYIKTSTMGGKKFDFAPRIEYTMVLIKDSIYTPTIDASKIPAFENIVGKDVVDVAKVTADPVLTPPPGAPKPAGTGVPGGALSGAAQGAGQAGGSRGPTNTPAPGSLLPGPGAPTPPRLPGPGSQLPPNPPWAPGYYERQRELGLI